jgi:hypothetical protein
VGDTEKYPYVVGICAENGFGTGILISPGHVLTCKHVSNANGASFSLAGWIFVVSTKGVTPAHTKKVDNTSDLALLELATPIVGPTVQFTFSSPQPAATLHAVGVQEIYGSQQNHLTVAEVELKYRNKNEAGGRILDIQFEGGARPGYSGGPVVIEDQISFCVGVTRCGGNWSYSTNAIGMAHIDPFAHCYISSPSLPLPGPKDESSANTSDSKAPAANQPGPLGNPKAKISRYGKVFKSSEPHVRVYMARMEPLDEGWAIIKITGVDDRLDGTIAKYKKASAQWTKVSRQDVFVYQAKDGGVVLSERIPSGGGAAIYELNLTEKSIPLFHDSGEKLDTGRLLAEFLEKRERK